jgi:hypothetical protein
MLFYVAPAPFVDASGETSYLRIFSRRGNRVMFRKALVVSAITASMISAVGFSTTPIPAALPPATAPVVRITEADGLMQKIVLELRRCRGD